MVQFVGLIAWRKLLKSKILKTYLNFRVFMETLKKKQIVFSFLYIFAN